MSFSVQTCGFSSSRYFSTLFGQHFHCTPSDFRIFPRAN
ncbi:MAG: AraC family transcriptional regulator [Thermoguttaceae bacterium]